LERFLPAGAERDLRVNFAYAPTRRPSATAMRSMVISGGHIRMIRRMSGEAYDHLTAM
jgi:hypothetical protein